MKRIFPISVLCLISLCLMGAEKTYYVGQPFVTYTNEYQNLLPAEYPFSPNDGGATMVTEVEVTSDSTAIFKIFCTRPNCEYKYRIKRGTRFYLANVANLYMCFSMVPMKRNYQIWDIKDFEDNKVTFEIFLPTD